MSPEIKHIPPAVVTDAELQTRTVYRGYSRTIVHPADASTVDQMIVAQETGR